MENKGQRAKEIMDAIRIIFVTEWDPIGVMNDAEWPRDEYDAYIGEIYKFLARGESEEFIARHLCFIEEKMMGLGCPAMQSRLPVAQKLMALNVSVQV